MKAKVSFALVKVVAAFCAVWMTVLLAMLPVGARAQTPQADPFADPYKENWCALASKHLSEGFSEI